MKAKNATDPDRSGIAWLTAADIMQREVISVRLTDTIAEVERVMADAGISGVPVLSADGRVAGVLSTSDLIIRRADGDEPEGTSVVDVDEDGEEVTVAYGSGSDKLTAGDVMTPDAESIAPDTDLREIARRMVDSKIHRLLVVEKTRLVGIVSTIDILRALAS